MEELQEKQPQYEEMAGDLINGSLKCMQYSLQRCVTICSDSNQVRNRGHRQE
jgi:hypothetical protein